MQNKYLLGQIAQPRDSDESSESEESLNTRAFYACRDNG
jgi:hypothetical protein